MTTQVQVSQITYTVTIREYITAKHITEFYWIIQSANGAYISATSTCKTQNGAMRSAKSFLNKYYVA